MKRKSLAMSMLLLMPAMMMPAMAGSPLSAVPQDAIAFVTIPNVAALDSGIERTLMQLGMADMVPAQQRSPLFFLKNMFGATEGLNETGAVTLIVMPAANKMMIPASVAVSVAATDPSAMIAAMNPGPGPDGVSMVQMMGGGQTMGAYAGEDRVVFSMNPPLAKQIVENTTTIESRLTDEEKAGIGDLTFALWADASGWKNVFAEDLDGLKEMMKFSMTMQGISPEDADRQMQFINMLIDGAKSMYFGLGLRESGLDFRAGFEAIEGSELASLQKGSISTGKPMLNGLPNEPFILAGAQIASEAQLKAQKEFQKNQIAGMFAGIPPEQKEKLQPQLDKITADLTELSGMGTGARFSVSVLPASPDGLAAITLLTTTSDPSGVISRFKSVFDTVKTIDLGEDAAEFAMVLGAASWAEKAETIDGVSVHKVMIDASKIDMIDEEDWSEVTKVIGQEGLTVRLAQADDHTVALSFGGGKARMATVLAAAKANESGLESRPGIEKVAPLVLQDRTACGYLNVDEAVNLVRDIAKALDDEDEFPLTMPQLNAPVAMALKTTNNSARGDMHVPMEVMVAVKDMILTMTGTGGPGAESQTESGM